MKTFPLPIVIAALIALVACSGDDNFSASQMQSNAGQGLAGSDSGTRLLPIDEEIVQLRQPANPQRNAYYGDLHVHTANSFDAYVFGTMATPDDAYRYAKGQPLAHPSGYQMQLRRPLDFYAVTDHAMFLGLVKESADTSTVFSQ